MSQFINPANVVAQAGLKPGQTVVDFGCGAGFYAVAAAKAVGNTGTVYGVDVQDAKLAATQSAARQNGFKNVLVIKADLDKPFLDFPEATSDTVILASIIHEIDSREMLIKNAYRVLKTGGRLLAIEWKKEMTPIGPAVEKRVSETELEQELIKAGFRKEKNVATDGYHYAMVFVK
jgi:ubiquinone/menaquinone biosynthesis C-methylase UbiE